MLKKLKKLDLYINHGVWIFLPGNNELVKRKIYSIDVHYLNNHLFAITSLCIEGVGIFSPEEVYMTRKEAFMEGIKHFQKRLNEVHNEMEHHKNNMEFQLDIYKNKIDCQIREIKNILKSQDRFLMKKE